MPRATILYDADCGFCKWSTAKVLGWDRHRRLRPVALQDREASVLLAGMDHEKKMASWHLVSAEGAIYSAGSALPPLLRLLPAGKVPAAAASRFPRLANGLYGAIAARRGLLGRSVKALGGANAIARAERRIRERA